MTKRDGEWLRASRLSLGLTLQQLADRMQMQGKTAADHLRHMEKGRRAIPGPIKALVQLFMDNAEIGKE